MLYKKISDIKSELRQMVKKDLMKMVFSQPERNCILGGTCPFLLNYQQILFCVSEVLGQGCQLEKLSASLSDGEAAGNGPCRDVSMDLMDGPYLPGLGQNGGPRS